MPVPLLAEPMRSVDTSGMSELESNAVDRYPETLVLRPAQVALSVDVGSMAARKSVNALAVVVAITYRPRTSGGPCQCCASRASTRPVPGCRSQRLCPAAAL